MAKKTSTPDADPPPKPDPGGSGPKNVTEDAAGADSRAAKKKPTGKPQVPQQDGKTTTDLSKASLTKEVVWRDPAKLTFPFVSAVRKHTEQEEADLRASIHEHGILQPLLITADGRIIEGNGRARIAIELGKSAVPCVVVERIGDEEAWEAAVKLNTDRRHLTREERLQTIAELLRRDPGQSDRAIARKTHSNKGTVGKKRKELEAAGQIPESDERRGGNDVVRRASDNQKKGNGPANKTPKPGSSASPAPDTPTDESADETHDPTVASGAALLSELAGAVDSFKPKVQGLINLIRDGDPQAPGKVAVRKIADAFEKFAEDLNGAFAPGKDQDEDNTQTP